MSRYLNSLAKFLTPLKQPAGRRIRRIEVKETLLDHDDHVNPGHLTRMVGRFGVVLVMAQKTRDAYWGVDSVTSKHHSILTERRSDHDES